MSRRIASVAGLVILLALLACTPATAQFDQLGSGATKLTLAPHFLRQLDRAGVEMAAVAPARLRNGVVSFPVDGGRFDPVAQRGTVENDGALRLSAGGRSIPIRFLQVKTAQRRSPLSAKVGGSQLKLASAGALAVSRAGFGSKISIRGLGLSAKLATRLGKKLRLKGIFREGQELGSAVVTAQPQTVAVLNRGKASLTLDAGFEAKLRELHVAVNPIFPAEHIGPSFLLPIFGGKLSPDAATGVIETRGSLELLQLGAGQLFWAESGLDLDSHAAVAAENVQPSPPYAGVLGRISIGDLDLTPAAVASNPGKRTVSISGARLLLQQQTAATLNEIFAKPQEKDAVFGAGEVLGVVSVTAQTQ
jgi:hypothetical protein